MKKFSTLITFSSGVLALLAFIIMIWIIMMISSSGILSLGQGTTMTDIIRVISSFSDAIEDLDYLYYLLVALCIVDILSLLFIFFKAYDRVTMILTVLSALISLALIISYMMIDGLGEIVIAIIEDASKIYLVLALAIILILIDLIKLIYSSIKRVRMAKETL